MFRGSVPADLHSIILKEVATWDCKDVYVGCSGNFTIERILGDKFALHGCDVTLYSSAIGYYLSGAPLSLALAPEYEDDYAWLKPGLVTPEGTLATVLLASRMVETLDRDNEYYNRLREGFRLQWPTLLEKTVAKVQAVKLRLASYACEDVLTWVDRVPKDAGVICYPPFFARDYTLMYESLAKLFSWEGCQYQELTDELHMTLFERIRERRFWLYGTKDKLDEFAPSLRWLAKTTNRAVPIYCYSNQGGQHLVAPRQELESIPYQYLAPGERVEGDMALLPLTGGQFSLIRSKYMNPNIRPGTATQAFAVMVGNRVVGAFAFSVAPSPAQWSGRVTTPAVYLLSDFPVADTSYPRLAKLVLFAALSKESQLLAERMTRARVRSLVTTAFAKNPVSMKYRGLFQLLNRKETKGWEDGGGDYYKQRYMLNYGAEIGRWTLKEGLDQWLAKHATQAE